MGNLPSLISGNGEPLWILEQRKTVFSGDSSSSCVEDGGRQGSQQEPCTKQRTIEMEMRYRGGHSETELAETGE